MRDLLSSYAASREAAMQALAQEPQARAEYQRHTEVAGRLFERIAAQPVWQRAVAVPDGAFTAELP